MYYLKDKDARLIIQEDSERGKVGMTPLFYADNFQLRTISWVEKYNQRNHYKYTQAVNKNPDYIFFYGDEKLNERIKNAENILGILTFQKTINPGLVDYIAYLLNPKHNRNMTVNIYKVNN